MNLDRAAEAPLKLLDLLVESVSKASKDGGDFRQKGNRGGSEVDERASGEAEPSQKHMPCCHELAERLRQTIIKTERERQRQEYQHTQVSANDCRQATMGIGGCNPLAHREKHAHAHAHIHTSCT